jgi:hypothetical protein
MPLLTSLEEDEEEEEEKEEEEEDDDNDDDDDDDEDGGDYVIKRLSDSYGKRAVSFHLRVCFFF